MTDPAAKSANSVNFGAELDASHFSIPKDPDNQSQFTFDRFRQVVNRVTSTLNEIGEIDAVFTWVDPSNEEWNKEKEYWSAKYFKKQNTTTNGCNRYSSFDEIKYGLRSVQQNLPWIRRIFLVTNNGSHPKWLDIKHPKISVVDYRTLLPKGNAPTYNSNTIEAFLWKIPGLADHFIYFNDDFIILKPLTISDFVDSTGKWIYPLETDVLFRYFQSSKILLYIEENFIKADSGVAQARMSSMKRLGIEYEGDATAHAPKIYNKTICYHFSQLFSNEIEDLLRNKFRTSTNFTYLEALCHYLAKKMDAAVLSKKQRTRIMGILDYRFLNSIQIRYTAHFLEDYMYMAIQDARKIADKHEEDKFKKFMRKIFPTPSPWELTGHDSE